MCVASCQRAFGNKAISCVRSCAPASACTGSKAELFPQGAEALLLRLPVHEASQRAHVAFDDPVRTVSGGRKKKQLFLNLRSQMRELQNLTEPRSADLSYLRQFPIAAYLSLGDQAVQVNRPAPSSG